MKQHLMICLLLFAALSPAAEKSAVPLPDLLNPGSLYVTEDRLYVVDGCSILIYDLNDFKLLKTFGQEGEGPQEFKDAVQTLYFLGDRMLVNSVGKLSVFTRHGDFISETKAPSGSRAGDYCPLGDGYAAVQFTTEDRTFYLNLNLYDSALIKTKQLLRVKDDFQPGKYMMAYSQNKTFDVLQNRLYVAFDGEFKIPVFDASGELEFTIAPEYERLKMDQAHREAADHYYRTDPYYKKYYDRIRSVLTFPDRLPAIKSFTFSEDTLYVETYRKNGRLTEFHTFSPSGKFSGVRHLPLIEDGEIAYSASRLYRIRNGCLYQLVEDEEEWVIHITELE
jgi:hypothetical protein